MRFFRCVITATGLSAIKRGNIDLEGEYVQLNGMRSRQLHDALEKLTKAIREVEAVLETMRAEHDPLASHIFVSRRQYRNIADTKGGKRREMNARLSFNTACELGFRGSLDEWRTVDGFSRESVAQGPSAQAHISQGAIGQDAGVIRRTQPQFLHVAAGNYTGKSIAVKIEWTYGSNDYDLYIHKRNPDGSDGDLVGSSGGGVPMEQSVSTSNQS